MPFLGKLGAVAVVLETNEGTEQSAVAGDLFLAEDIEHKPEIAFAQPNIASDSLSPEPGLPTLRSGVVTFRSLYKGSGAAGTPPEIDAALKAAAFAETIDAGKAVFYDAAASSNPSATVTVWINETASSGKKYTFRGCRIKWSVSWVLGELMYVNWEVTCADWTEFDVTPLVGIYQTSQALVFQGATISLGGYSGCINSLSLDSGAQIALRQCVGNIITPGLFTGAGLDDMAFSGVFTADFKTSYRYRVEIDATGTPDTFRWSNDGGETWEASGVSITGSAQLLENGLYITFAATTGHTIGDRWDTSIANGGYISALITSFDPTGSMDPEEVLIATRDQYQQLRNGTTMILSIVIVTSAGNNVALYAQSVQYTEITPGARDDIRFITTNLKLNKNTN